MNEPAPAAELRQVVAALGAELAEVLAAPHGLGIGVRDVVIADPEDPADASRVGGGDLVLVVGAHANAAAPVLRAAARAGAAAVAVKGGDTASLVSAANETGIALLGVPGQARWEQVRSLAAGTVETARASRDSEAAGTLGDLFSLAQTVATLTGGIVTIEDTASRVLAYSSAGDEVDELRRLSILGRQGPQRYLTMLRDWGVFGRLRAGEGIVHVAEHPELGIRRRIAAGIHAGPQPLGTIWVQEGSGSLADDADRALLGAARAAAPHLVRGRTNGAGVPRLRENLLAALLDGRLGAAAVAEDIGADPALPAVVVAFELHAPQAARAERELARAKMVNLIAVHAAAYRRSALVNALGSRLYALLPDLPSQHEGGNGALAMARDITAAASRHLGAGVSAGVGGVVVGLAEAVASRDDADRVLEAMARHTDALAGRVASLPDVRSEVLFSELLALFRAHPRLRDPEVSALARYDAEHGASLAPSVLAYLDAFSDVREAARQLHVHPNTLRYRLRRASEVAGIDLGDPRKRLFAQLQLRLPD